MKAGVVHARKDLRYEDVDTPRPKEKELLIKVKYTGICGSDVPRVNGDACHYYPNVLGHEFSGTVAEVGKGVTRLAVGDRVSGVPLVPCMECEDCKRGDYALCKHYSFIGSRQYGSFAEYVCVPERCAVRLADEVSLEQGALFEPATIAVHGLERVPYAGGRAVAVVGGGTIGLLTAQFAKIYGAAQVVVFDIQEERLELAQRLGADAAIDSSRKGWLAQAMGLTGGRGFDYVYGTAAAEPTIKAPFDLVANKGYVSYIGTPTQGLTFSVDEWEKINRKEFTLTGSWMSYSAPFPGREWETVAHFFATRQLSYDGLVFKTLPLSQIADAFKLYETPGAVKGKILIDSEA